MNQSPETPTYLARVFSAYVDYSTIFVIAVPVAYLIWSFKTAISYHKDNDQFHNEIQDVLDRRAFQTVVTPLFSYINSSLSEELIPELDTTVVTDKAVFIKDVDDKKQTLLRERDFSYLEPAVEFQDAIIKILSSKKNQLALKKLIKNGRRFIISLTIVNALTVANGVMLIYMYRVLNSENIATGLLYSWGILFLASLFLGALYFINSIKKEGLKNE